MIDPDRKPVGRPRKYPPGRIHVTARFTPDAYADLKQAALASGRSVSEEIEQRVLELDIYKRLLDEKITALKKAGLW